MTRRLSPHRNRIDPHHRVTTRRQGRPKDELANDPLAEHGVARRPPAPGRRARSPRRAKAPDGGNAGDVVKPRGGDPGHQPRGKHRQQAAAFTQGINLRQLWRDV